MNSRSGTSSSSRWIGLALIRSKPGNQALGTAEGAVVAVVGDAGDELGFGRLVERELDKHGYIVLELDDVELLESRERNVSLPSDLKEGIDRISSNTPVAMGTFHAFRKPE